MIVLFRAVLAFLAVKVGTLAVNVVTFPVLKDTNAAQPGRRSVALLVPMRNETHRLAAALPGLLAQTVDELIMLDDCSTDTTFELTQSLAAGYSHVRILAGAPTPPGWAGKTWACSQLAAHARAEVLIFCDADVLLAPGALAAVLAQMELQRADLLSVFPHQITRTLGEHLLVPLIDDVLLCFLPFPLLRAQVPSAATANGSVLAFDRLAYDLLGGFDAVRGDIVEDVALARLARRHGLQLGLVLGADLVRTRMYSGYRACAAGLGRGMLPVTGGSRLLLVLAAGWHLLVYTVPVLLCWRRPRWRLLVLIAVAERLVVEAKTGRRQWWQAMLAPLSPVSALPVFAQAVRRRQQWKDRTYTHPRLRRPQLRVPTR